MKHLSISILSLLIGICAYAQFSNPIIPGFYPDPSFCRVGDDYYLVNSTFQYFPGVPIFHSKDLVHWEQIGNVLDRESQLPLGGARNNGGIYAPTIRYHEGMFYMIVTNCSGPGNLVVHSENPAGPWSEPAYIKIGGIDPSLFWDEDGKCWFTGCYGSGIVLAELDPMTGEVKSDVMTIWEGTGGRYPEAPHMYKKDGWYYLLIAEGGTEMGHGVTIARARDIKGPYLSNPSNPILTHFNHQHSGNKIQGTGHADLLQAEDGSWWLCCLGFRLVTGDHHILGRETFLAPVRWDKGAWPVVNGDGHVDLEMNCPTLPEWKPVKDAAEPEFLCDFTREKAGFDWVYLRNPDMRNYEYSADGLTMKATTMTLDEPINSPTFLAHRQQHTDFIATATLSLENAGNKDEAGISTYMDVGSHYDFFITRKGGKAYAQARLTLGHIIHTTDAIALQDLKEVQLRIDATANLYTFLCSSDKGRTWKKVGEADTRYISTETAGGFTGVMLALYATKASEKSAAKAIVKTFDYSKK